jgi:Cytochrome P460
MLHSTARSLKYFGALSGCATFAFCTVFIARSEAQGGKESQPQAASVANSSKPAPLFGITIQAGYRDWRLISVAHEEGSLNDIRAILGNDVAIKAYREGKLPFPDGTIIARIAWKDVPSEENNKVFGRAQSFVPGSAPDWYLQFMVKDSKKYAATRGWGYAQFDKDGNPSADEAKLKACAPCHEPAKPSDFVFTHYAP